MSEGKSSFLWLCLMVLAMSGGLVVLTGCGEKSEGTKDNPTGQAADTSGAKALVLTDATFKEVTSKGIVLVDFWATWCPPCVRQAPIIEKIAAQYAGRVTVAKLDVDKNRKTAHEQGVQNIPTLIVFKDGKVFRPFIGLTSEEKLKAVLDKALSVE